jgi:hypothetical protein
VVFHYSKAYIYIPEKIMKKRIYRIIIFNLLPALISAQTGGDHVYEFLNLTHSALITSIGGSNVSITGGSLDLAYSNPSLLDHRSDNSLALNYSNYFAGINYGLAMYSATLKNAGNIAGGITYLNYGSFTEADESGNIKGSFNASEFAFSAVFSRELDSMFTAGINLKPVLSHLEKYTSFGVAFDLGASWHNRNNLLSAGIVLKNIGYQITTYAGEARGKLPFEIMAGISARLAHAPLRFSLTLRHLEKFDLTHEYNSTDESESSGSDMFFENLMRHVIAGMEVKPHRNFYFSLGYNHQRRSELMEDSGAAGTGFTWGFGINTSKICLGFGRASYHLSGASNNITLIIRPKTFIDR